MIDIIERNSRRLSNITNDLLALAELEEKEKLDLEREYVYSNIIEIAKYSIEILKIHSEKKKIRIKTNFSSDEISIKCLSSCLLYTSDAAYDTPCVALGGRRIIK